MKSRFGFVVATGGKYNNRHIRSRLVNLQQCAAADLGITIDRPEGRADDQPPDQAWVHPPTLGGVMLGLSRPTMAWQWSGHPERVEEVA